MCIFFSVYVFIIIFSQAATRVMKHLIEEFASSDLFGRDNYEFYARVTGRVLRVQGEWICSFQYPPPAGHSSQQCYPSAALEHYLLGKLFKKKPLCLCFSNSSVYY